MTVLTYGEKRAPTATAVGPFAHWHGIVGASRVLTHVIRRIELETEAEVPAVSDSVFQLCAETAKENCPVSKALSGVEILLKSSRLTQVPVERA